MPNIEELTEEVFNHIKKVKHQVINIDDVSEILKEKLGEDYTSQIGIAVKSNLKEHQKIDFFREGDCYYETKCYYCVGNWIAIKGLYDNSMEAKTKLGILSWQRFVGDWDDL